MGLRITVPDADFSRTAVGFVPPVADGLAFWNVFGTDAALNTRNLAPGGLASTVVGVPVVGDHWIECTGMVNFVQTAVPASDEFTLLAVAEAVLPDVSGCPLISNTGSIWPTSGAQIGGAALYLNNIAANNSLFRVTAQQAANNGGTATTVQASTPDFNVTTAGVQVFAGRCTATGDRIVNNLSNGATATTASALAAALGAPYRIGSQYNASQVGVVRIYAAAIYDRALDAGELAAVYAHFEGYFARRGITV